MALWGTSTTSFFQGLGSITVDTKCVVGTEIVVPAVAGESESSDVTLSSGAIIGIIIGGVVVFLMVAALTAFCCYKKHVFNNNKTGVEVVSV